MLGGHRRGYGGYKKHHSASYSDHSYSKSVEYSKCMCPPGPPGPKGPMGKFTVKLNYEPTEFSNTLHTVSLKP